MSGCNAIALKEWVHNILISRMCNRIQRSRGYRGPAVHDFHRFTRNTPASDLSRVLYEIRSLGDYLKMRKMYRCADNYAIWLFGSFYSVFVVSSPSQAFFPGS